MSSDSGTGHDQPPGFHLPVPPKLFVQTPAKLSGDRGSLSGGNGEGLTLMVTSFQEAGSPE
jgi:hypothetical protein